MPIHDQGYRRFGGSRSGRGNAWLVIASSIIRSMLQTKKFMVLLIVAWFPFLVRVGQVYFSANFAQIAFLAPTASTFREFLDQQSSFVFVVTIYVGAGLIANDRRANALQIYLAKPLTRAEYVAGKAAALMAFLMFITFVPAILLLCVQILLAGSFAFVSKNLFLFPAITVYSDARVHAGDLRHARALVDVEEPPVRRHHVRRPHFVHEGHPGHVLAADAVLGGLAHFADGLVDRVGDTIFRVTPRYDTPMVASLLVVIVLIVLSIVGSRTARPRCGGGRVTTAATAIVEATQVSKWYGQVIGLNDVSVVVPHGITGLLGPNGAGKSTFMKLMTGQLAPSKGRVTVFGESIWNNPSIYSRIGFCPEQDAFYDRMTGLEWVTALIRLNGYDEARAVEAARRALEHVDLLDAADKKIGAYSKGMRQRVKLAQAIVHDPELLILDEPLSGMDPMRAPENDPLDQGLGEGRQEHRRVESHPARGRVDDLEHPADQQRTHPRRRQRAPDSGSDRRAPAHGPHPGTGAESPRAAFPRRR